MEGYWGNQKDTSRRNKKLQLLKLSVNICRFTYYVFHDETIKKNYYANCDICVPKNNHVHPNYVAIRVILGAIKYVNKLVSFLCGVKARRFLFAIQIPFKFNIFHLSLNFDFHHEFTSHRFHWMPWLAWWRKDGSEKKPEKYMKCLSFTIKY